MNFNNIKSVYFIGAGGIGMSALVRYFLSKNIFVAGYDRTSTKLTQELIAEGAQIHFEDNIDLIPLQCKDKQQTLVVLTPAIPQDHIELNYFRSNGFYIQKRAEVLGDITRTSKGICVAGTHGKTTTSTLAAHLFHNSSVGCTAFLGGIYKNETTNLLLSQSSLYTVIEADEYDRSFHQLTPYISVITSSDPDHLDIYSTEEAYLESFAHYTSLIQPGGSLIIHQDATLQPRLQKGVNCYSYSKNSGDFHAENIRIENGEIYFDFVGPDVRINDIQLGVPVSINIDNGIAAMAMGHLCGISNEELKTAMASFRGIERRFDFQIKTDKIVFLTDYAHHPSEIKQSLISMRELYADKKITAIFQPHLFSRTNDFYKEFAESLSLADEVILTDIYPARELPMPGVTSELIFKHLRADMQKKICKKEELVEIIKNSDIEVLILMGAGDIINYSTPISETFKKRL